MELASKKEAVKEPEVKRLLSKKELKEKEMADLDALLNEMGVKAGDLFTFCM